MAGLTLNYDLGFANLTSVSSFFQLDRTFNDTVAFVGAILTALGVPPGSYTQESFVAGSVTESTAQEIRLTSKGDNRLDWVAGAFYRSKDSTPTRSYRFRPMSSTRSMMPWLRMGSIHFPQHGRANGTSSTNTSTKRCTEKSISS